MRKSMLIFIGGKGGANKVGLCKNSPDPPSPLTQSLLKKIKAWVFYLIPQKQGGGGGGL